MKLGILCTKYLSNVSENISKMLFYFFNLQNIELYFSISEMKNCDFYFLVASQFFDSKQLVLKMKNHKFVIYQLEQLNKIRLSTELVELSVGVFDYTELNRKMYNRFEILYPPFSSYVPIDPQEKEYDILFYGCLNERRIRILKQIPKHYRIKIITNKRGQELYQYIQKSKIVLNLNFYSPAIFEICRINEIISYDTYVISELDLIDEQTFNLYKDYIYFIKKIENSDFTEFLDMMKTLSNLEQKKPNYMELKKKINLYNKNKLYNILYNDRK